jgi:hypothetical protein
MGAALNGKGFTSHIALKNKRHDGPLVSLIVQKKTKTSTVLCPYGADPRLLAWRLTQYISLARTFLPPVGDVSKEHC